MKISKGFMLREIAGEYIVVPIGKAVFQFMGLITLNEVGRFLWELLQSKEYSMDQLIQKICQSYEVEEAVAQSDVREFIDALKSRGILSDD